MNGTGYHVIIVSQVLHKLREAARTRWADLVNETSAVPVSPEEAVQLIPIASGKGGVGKTNIAVGLAVAAGLQFRGTEKRVLLIDGDLGMPNTDLVLGVRPQASLGDLIDRSIDDLASLIAPTRYPGLDFIAGAEEATLVLGNLYYQQRRGLMNQIGRLRSSLVIFDLGASASKEILDFFAMSSSGIIVLNPEPSSIRDGYVFLKNALMRRVRHELEGKADVRQEYDRLTEECGGDWRKLRAAIPISASAALRALWAEIMERYSPLIIMNRVESFAEGLDTARKFTRDAETLLGVRMRYLGSVLRDDAVMKAVKMRRPFLIADPKCPASRCIEAITQNLLNDKGLDLNSNFSSFGRIFTMRLMGRPV